MITLVYRRNYKLIWDRGALVHIFYIKGALLSIAERC